MKHLLTLTVFLFTILPSWAQLVPVYNSSSVQRRMLTEMLNSRYWYRNSDLLENNKYKFTVTLKDGTTRDVFSKIFTDTSLHRSYLLVATKRASRFALAKEDRIYPNQTLKITRLNQDSNHPERKEVLEGRATDSCWLFKVVSGKITAYSFLSEKAGIHTGYLSAFQVDSGEIQTLSSEKLKSVIAASGKAMKAFRKKDYYTAIIRYNQEFSKKQ